MCGSGTIPVEAALIARNIAPGVFRKEFAFEKWVDFDQDMFDNLYNDDSQEREFTHKIYGYDNNPKANEIATHNVKAAGVSKDIILKLQPFQQFEQPAEKSIIITNPPYGERISTNDLLGLYSMIGERLKHAFVGNDAWVLSYREECFDQIGLKPVKKRHYSTEHWNVSSANIRYLTESTKSLKARKAKKKIKKVLPKKKENLNLAVKKADVAFQVTETENREKDEASTETESQGSLRRTGNREVIRKNNG